LHRLRIYADPFTEWKLNFEHPQDSVDFYCLLQRWEGLGYDPTSVPSRLLRYYLIFSRIINV
jgi:hypothetical protein